MTTRTQAFESLVKPDGRLATGVVSADDPEEEVVVERITIVVAVLTYAGSGVVLTATRVDGRTVVTGIERMPATLAAVVPRLKDEARSFPHLPAETFVVIDAAGLGRALWEDLDVGRVRGWQLYEKRGRERQELVDSLRVAQHQKRVHVTAVDGAEDMRKALASYRVEVGEDGNAGSELIVALALAVIARMPRAPKVW